MVGVSKNVFINPMQTYNPWNNPDILQNKNMINFPDWSHKGIKYFEYIFKGTDFILFDGLVIQYK